MKALNGDSALEPSAFLADYFGLASLDHQINIRVLGNGQTISQFITVRGLRSSSNKLSELIELAQQMSAGIYFGAAPRKDKFSGKKENVPYCLSVWADIDPVEQTAQMSLEEIQARLNCLPDGLQNPSYVIFSGRGYQIHWMLQSQCLDLGRIEAINRSLVKLLRADKAAVDASRMLRLPQSRNQKSGQLAKVVIRNESRFAVSDFDAILAPESPISALAMPVQYPHSSGELVIQRCGFMRYFAEDAEILSEPHWHQGVGVLAYTVEAPEILHKYSYPHPGYSPSDTDAKMKNWKRNGKGPPTCRNIQEKCGDEACKACPYNGKIKSPIVLGYASRPAERGRDVMPYPVNVLPGVLRDFALNAAMALQCPVDYVACSLLAIASIVIGANRRIQLAPEWLQGASLWIAMVGTPSAKKTPALLKAFDVLRKIEQELYSEHKRDMALYDLAMQSYDVNLRTWKKDPSTDPPIQPEKPMLKRVTTSDSTVEALGELLAVNSHGIGLVCDELSGMMRSMNQYKGGRGADRSHYLSMWSNAQMTIDRKGKEPIIVQSPYLTIIGGIQPDVLLEMSNQGVEDGMKERFLFCCPAINMDEPVTGMGISAEIRSALAVCIQKLFDARSCKPVTFVLSVEAQVVFLNARREWHRLRCSDGFPGELEAYYVKMENYLGRLALILHEVKRASGETNSDTVEEATMLEAKTLADYFLNHARVALGMVMQTSEEQRVEKAARWIQKKGLLVVSSRDLTTYKVAGCRKTSQAKALLQSLQDYGYGYWQAETARLIFFQEAVSLSADRVKV